MSFEVYKDGLIQFVGLTSSGQGPIVGVTNATINAGIKTIEGTGAGQVTPSMVSVITAEPTAQVTLYDIGTLIGNGVNTSPLPFGSGQTCTGVTVWGVRVQEDGTIVTQSGNQVGISYSYAQGLVTFNGATARQGGAATATMTIYPESVDGVTDPVTVTPNAQLPSVAALTQMYTVGPAEVNSGTIASVNSLDYAANYKVERKASQGQLFPVKTYVSEYKPEITIGGYDASLYSSYGQSTGTALGAGNFAIYLPQLAPNSTRISPSSPQHIKLAGAAGQGMVTVEQATLGPDTGEARIKIKPIVGTNPVISMSLSQIT
ncbi:MAG TPA: hypothetical protein VFG04_03760 [Planctomycetaceae bacterium]|jgi:hypothetical protein|nr:hypothetical protein [Planctomycetaceae bacterium]